MKLRAFTTLQLLLIALMTVTPPTEAGGLGGAGDLSSLYDGSYALLIGVSDYPETQWDSLPGVDRDIDELSSLLERSGFTVEHVDPPHSRDSIRESVERFFRMYGAVPGNQLLVYYAGHGTTLRDRHGQLTGFIVPADAPMPASDLAAEDYSQAIEMSWLEALAADEAVRAKHVLFMFDSCFSGAIFQRKRGAGQTPAVIDYFARQDVRQFISSGTHAQQVPDESVFQQMFVEALAGRGDVNGDGFITGTELGQFLRETVSNITRARQTPQFARMSKNGVDYGEFMFVSPIGPHARAAQPENTRREQITGSIAGRFRNCQHCPEMVTIPAGSAVFGSPPTESGRDRNEAVQERVQLPGRFALSVFEITAREWHACFREGGCSRWVAQPTDGSMLPVAGVSWEDAREYTEWLSDKTGFTYRLPSELEWEYAARAGSTAARPWGESIGNNRANCAACGSVFDGRRTAPVGSFQANGFGLHDMLGNVWEWVRDCDQMEAAASSGVEYSYNCYLRGGSFATSPISVRSAARSPYPARKAQPNFGFRVLREAN